MSDYNNCIKSEETSTENIRDSSESSTNSLCQNSTIEATKGIQASSSTTKNNVLEKEETLGNSSKDVTSDIVISATATQEVEEEEMLTINVRWNGEMYPVSVHKDMTLLDFKESVQSQTKVRPDKQKLLNIKCRGEFIGVMVSKMIIDRDNGEYNDN